MEKCSGSLALFFFEAIFGLVPHGFDQQREGLHMQQAEKILGASYNDLTSISALDGPSGNAALHGVRAWVEAV